MSSVRIEQIDKLVKAKVVQYSTKNLTAPGDNYGSTILAVDIKRENGEIIHSVAKLLPPNQFLRQMFNCPTTFKIELGFYKTILPTYQLFHENFSNKREPLDFFPKFLGGRYNINDDDEGEIDDHACVLLENLKRMGFQTMERTEGFNYETAKLILNNLARFHGVGIGLKFQNPCLFKEKIKPFLRKYKLFEIPPDVSDKFKKDLGKTVQHDNNLAHILPKLLEIFDKSSHPFNNNLFKNDEIYEDEPWTTIIHMDLWVNNTMVKHFNGKPVKNKFVDFQVYEYGSPTKDLIFFLFTSLHDDALFHLDELVKYYYGELIESLKDYNCDIAEFSYERFMNSLAKWVKDSEIIHSLVMLNPIFLEKENVKDLSEMGPETLKEEKELSKKQLDRGVFIIKTCLENNWI